MQGGRKGRSVPERWALRPSMMGFLPPSRAALFSRSQRNVHQPEPAIASLVTDDINDTASTFAETECMMEPLHRSTFQAEYVTDDRPDTSFYRRRQLGRSISSRQVKAAPAASPWYQEAEHTSHGAPLKAPPTHSLVPQKQKPPAPVPSRKPLSKQSSVTKKKNNPVPNLTVEVSPGKFLPLRGALETTRAIENCYYRVFECICCADEDPVFVIQDASYAICPRCKVVCRLDRDYDMEGGVGLGFTFETLQDIQSGIS